MKKVIFLDVDGVLVTWSSMKQLRVKDAEKFPDGVWRWKMFGDPQLARLGRIVEATGAEIVLSSSWRRHNRPEDFNGLLAAAGVKFRTIDQTPNLDTEAAGGLYMAMSREQEILAWLEMYGPAKFVILDDANMATLGKYHVQTTMERGLTDVDVEKAILILEAP